MSHFLHPVVRHLHQQLEAQAITDELTGLLNRRGFYQALESALGVSVFERRHRALAVALQRYLVGLDLGIEPRNCLEKGVDLIRGDVGLLCIMHMLVSVRVCTICIQWY